MAAAPTITRPHVAASVAPASDSARLRLVTRLAERLGAERAADPLTVRAVTLLTDAAAPTKADAMRPHTGDASPLVERLSVWAARRAGDDAIAGAMALLDADTAA